MCHCSSDEEAVLKEVGGRGGDGDGGRGVGVDEWVWGGKGR